MTLKRKKIDIDDEDRGPDPDKRDKMKKAAVKTGKPIKRSSHDDDTDEDVHAEVILWEDDPEALSTLTIRKINNCKVKGGKMKMEKNKFYKFCYEVVAVEECWFKEDDDVINYTCGSQDIRFALLEQIDDSKNGLKEDYLRRSDDKEKHEVFFFSYHPNAKSATKETDIYRDKLCLFSDFDFTSKN